MKHGRFNQYLSWFAFFQTSSFLMFFGVNLSFFFFLNLFSYTARRRLLQLIRLDSWLKVMIVLFMAGAILGTANNLWEGNETALLNSLRVLPNYIYWGLLLLVFTLFAARFVIDYQKLFLAISVAVLVVLVYYVLLQDFVSNSMFLKRFGPNNFSLLLICYTPYVVYFLRARVHPVAAILVLAVLLFVQLVEGRRAGFGLVFVGGASAFLVPMLRFDSPARLTRLAAVFLLGLGIVTSPPVESFVQDQSSRVHQLVYASSPDYLADDRSYLTRLAMIEKGLTLFRDNILFGVGLNNFTKVNTEIKGEFQGAEFVVHKDIFARVSSHNSYINILAEGGLALAIPFASILLILLFNGLRYFGILTDAEKIIVISFVTMCVHIYFTNGIVNSLVWFDIGLLTYVVSRLRSRSFRSGLRRSQQVEIGA